MNSTKRKFNTLLQGMGNKSSNSPPSKDATVPTGVNSQVKKRRVIPTSSSIAPRAALAGHQKSASTATPMLPEEAPKYAPWDRAAFLRRLKTYSNLTDWTPKPAKVNEVEWAKRGWVCRKSERVRCCLCNVEIVVKLNRKEVEGKEEPVYIAGNIEDALVEKYVELIITSHDVDCLWRRRGCDDSIFKLPLSHTATTLHDLRSRYDELCSRGENLPYLFNLRLPPEFDLAMVLEYLPTNFFASPTQDLDSSENSVQKVNKVALQMALFGWQGHRHDRLGEQLGSVSCYACFRVLGLWLFKSKGVNEAGEEVEGAPVNCLDTVDEHRDYCPWRCSSSQNPKETKLSTAGLAGWEIVLRALKNDFQLRRSGAQQKEKPRTPSIEGLDGDQGGFGGDSEDEDARSIAEQEDKKRWARLKRVKSLFDLKKSKRLSAIEPKGKPV